MEATQGQIDGFFSQLPYKCHVEEVAGWDIDLRFALNSTAGWPYLNPYTTVPNPNTLQSEREFFVDNLLIRIHSIIEIISVHRPCAMGV